jgi:hypothetical protein
VPGGQGTGATPVLRPVRPPDGGAGNAGRLVQPLHPARADREHEMSKPAQASRSTGWPPQLNSVSSITEREHVPDYVLYLHRVAQCDENQIE